MNESRYASRIILRLRSGRWLALAVTLLNLLATSYIAAVRLEPFADLATYYQEAQLIAQGKGFTQPIKINVRTAATDAPYPTSDRFVYPIIVAAAIKLFGDSLAVANVVAAVSMALTALPLYALGQKLFDARAALLAVVLFALNPFYHVIGIQGWTDLTATLLYYGCLLAIAVYYLAPSAHGALWSGVLLALAALTREESILLALPLAVVWWWRGRDARHGMLFAAGPLVGFALRATYLQQTFGNAFYTERPYFFLPRWGLWYYLGTFTPSEYLDYVGGIGGAVSIRCYNLLRFVIDHFSDGWWYYTGIGMMPLTMLLGIVPALRLPLTPDQRALLKLFAGLITLQVLGGLGYPGYIDNGQAVRHGSFASPFILLVASAGLLAWWVRSRVGKLLVGAVVANYVLFAVVYLGVWGSTLTQPPYRGPIVLASDWARDHLPADAVLMTRRAAETHYFSGRTVVVTPSAPFAEMLAFARAHHVTHFVIGDVERNGTPNLLQGIKTFPQNFHTAYSTEGMQIVAINSYDFPSPLTLPNELYAGKTVGRPATLYDWNDLQVGGMGAAFAYLSAWGDLFNAALHPEHQPQPRAQAVSVRAGDSIELVRYTLADSTIHVGDELQLTLHWRARNALTTNYTIFAHLLDAAGALRAQKDSPPLDGARPTSAWVAGEELEDHLSFILPDDLSAGAYQLEVGLYDSATGVRLPLRDANGNRLADDRLLIEGLTIR